MAGKWVLKKNAKPTQKRNKKSRKPQPKRRAAPKTKLMSAATKSKIVSAMTASRSITGGGQQVAYAMANPAAFPNFRLSVTGDATPSCAALVHRNIAYTPDTLKGNYNDIVSGGGSSIHVFRDVLRSLVHLVEYPGGDFTEADAKGYMRYDSVWYDSDKDLESHLPTPIMPLYFEAKASFRPHGSFLYCGKVAARPNLRFIWLDRGVTLRFVVTYSTGASLPADAQHDRVQVYKLEGRDQVTDIQSLMPTSQGVLNMFEFHTLNTFGYYAIEYRSVTAHVGRKIYEYEFKTHITPIPPPPVPPSTVVTPRDPMYFGDCWGHLAAPAVDLYFPSLQRVRVNASSILISPSANMLNINGFIHCASTTENINWINYVGPDMTSTQPGAQGFLWDKRHARNGCYAILKPASLADLSWSAEVCLDRTSRVSDLAYRLDDDKGALHFYINCTEAGGNAAGQNWEITAMQAIEWQPRRAAQWVETHLPANGFNSLDTLAALDHIKAIHTFYDNPVHLQDIKSGLKSVYSFTKQHRGILSKTLSILFPGYSGLFAAGSRFLGSLSD